MALFIYILSQTSPNVPYIWASIPLCSNLNLRDIRESVDNDSRMQLLTLLKNPFITNLMSVISV